MTRPQAIAVVLNELADAYGVGGRDVAERILEALDPALRFTPIDAQMEGTAVGVARVG